MENNSKSASRTPLTALTQAKLPSRAMTRWVLLTPMIALVVLTLLMGATVWYLSESEKTQQAQALRSDVVSTQRTVRERLQSHEKELQGIANFLAERGNETQFRILAESFFAQSAETTFLAWIDLSGVVRSVRTSQSIPSESFDRVGIPLQKIKRIEAFSRALSNKKSEYSEPMVGRTTGTDLDVVVPIMRDGIPRGAVIATYSLTSLLLNTVPSETANRVAFTLADRQGVTLAQTRNAIELINKPQYEVGLDPIGQTIRMRGYALTSIRSFLNDVITTLVAGLIALAVVSQVLIWRNTRRRLGVESVLAEETAFRRAMENSMSTGMRVINLEGRITYVNPAFCRMVGFGADELTGSMPPFPYWPADTQDQLQKNLDRMLTGESPPSGLPINIMRKDGSRLIVRMYTSPLIDHNGEQTGWMTSVTDITEQTRIRQELAQAQERFITVLQALDAAVSVATPSPNDELLFANQAYKKWFGNSLDNGHRYLCANANGPWADVRDVFSPLVKRWFEVRVRSIQWVDGRNVEMVVATDITQERATEEAQREQHDRLQQTARLITMGEMASSLAHELNQPLTAIANYTSGAASRLRLAQSKGEPPSIDELIELLGKTARQAERAGQVIRRIRSFVKRNDPIRKPTTASSIVADTLGLAEIDARERGLEIMQSLHEPLPLLNVDPILIEQVLLNLVKNGLEAMRDSTHHQLIVDVSMINDQIMFSVIDRGHGVSKDMRGRLFDSFYTTKSDGMGMGLNICRSIIESHQGRLWFDDNPEGGCTFRFTLPVLPSDLANTVLSSSKEPRP